LAATPQEQQIEISDNKAIMRERVSQFQIFIIEAEEFRGGGNLRSPMFGRLRRIWPGCG
jgi:hypothetical protein